MKTVVQCGHVSNAGRTAARLRAGLCRRRATAGPFTLWDGKESIEQYAKRTNLPAKKTLDLGNGVKLELVLIPVGKFLMDSKDEAPQHEVTISKPFYMGKYEVTQEQYEAVMGKNPSNFKGATLPVETASWGDATKFCKKVSDKAGQTVRLATEAEWEFACRA